MDGGDADTLDGNDSPFFLDRTNHTGKQGPATIDPQGAGSGLDADTVDGQHAAAFAGTPHALGGADHAADSVADFNTKLTDAALAAHDGSIKVLATGIQAIRTKAPVLFSPTTSTGLDQHDTGFTLPTTSVGYVRVYLNGIQYAVGTSISSRAFYWGTAVAAVSNVDVPALTTLRFNPTVAGFNLAAATDTIKVEYEETLAGI